MYPLGLNLDSRKKELKNSDLNKREISFQKKVNGGYVFPVVEGIQELSSSLLSHPFDLVPNFLVLEGSSSR